MIISRKISPSGAVSIPKHIRAKLGWESGISVDIENIDDGTLVIRPHADKCRFCGNVKNLRKYRDLCVCGECSKKIKEVI